MNLTCIINVSKEQLLDLVTRATENRTCTDAIMLLQSALSRVNNNGKVLVERINFGDRMANVWSLKHLPGKCRCLWCGNEFEHEPLGIPVDVTDSLVSVIKTNSNKKFIKFTQLHSVYNIKTVGTYCSHGCRLAGCKNQHYLFESNERIDIAIKYIHKLFKIDYPTGTLIECPPPTIRQCYGGILTDDEYKKYLRYKPKFRKGVTYKTMQVAQTWQE